MADNILKKGLRFFNLGMDDDDDYDYIEEEEEEPRPPKKNNRWEKEEENIPVEKTARRAAEKPVQKITPLRQVKKQVGDMELCVIKPTKYEEDGKYITDTLLSDCTVVLNLEGIDVDLAQRIVDFASGTCYAINGNFRAISSSIILITPQHVEISGDFMDQVNGSLHISNMDI